MFRAMFSPIIRRDWLYLQLLVVFTQMLPAGVMDELKLIHDTSRQILGRILPDAANTVKCF
jgi:hypothetical protein